MHGKPLTDNLKNILLKHLDTAPKEILGDFPRIGRENANKMMAQTHIKLCEKFNVPLSENEKKMGEKVPSLLEMNVKPPENLDLYEIRSELNQNPRWFNKETKNSSTPLNAAAASTLGPGDVLLSEMNDILSEKQINTMAQIGVKSVNHINNLTVAQLNDLGLSLATIGEIQATAINMHNSNKSINSKEQLLETPLEDVDLRAQLRIPEDVDMRIFSNDKQSSSSPNQQNTASEIQTTNPNEESVSQRNELMSPPIDYSQYLKDSNINNEMDEIENEDDFSLKIDETYGSDYEVEEKKDSPNFDDGLVDDFEHKHLEDHNSKGLLLPPSIDTSAFLKAIPAKVDLSSSIQQLMEKDKPTRESHTRDPRTSKQKSPIKDKVPEISSPTYPRDPRNQSKFDETPPRTCIYEIESPSEDEEKEVGKDKDLRFAIPFLRDAENGDIDFRIPFTPLVNYYLLS